MDYRIGLDIGIASVGWSVIKCNDDGDVEKIIDFGVRTFDIAEVPKTGEPLAAGRREARSARRRQRRRAERLRRVRQLFADNGVQIDFGGQDVNFLRVTALDSAITANEFARVLYLICKNRGFKSNRKSEENDKEVGKLLQSAIANKNMMEERGYRTVGEMLLAQGVDDSQPLPQLNTRNRNGEYVHTVYRDALEQEIKLLFEAQRKYGNALATSEVETKFLQIFTSQRNFDEGPGKPSPYAKGFNVGKCVFEDELRAPKASYSFEYATALQRLNNLTVVHNGENTSLTAEQRSKLLSLIKKQVKVTYANVRKALALSDDYRFNLSYPRAKNDEDAIASAIAFEKKQVLSSMEHSHSIENALAEQNKNNPALVDEIAVVLSMAKSDDKRKQLISDNPKLANTLSAGEIDSLLMLNFDKFGMLGFTALRKIIPYLESGDKYSDACKNAGYNHSEFATARSYKLNTAEVRNKIDEGITSPVVKRSVCQTVKVINAIIDKYGSPLAINVELARDMSRSRSERDAVKRDQDKHFAENQNARQQFKQKFGIEPKGIDILKLKLYEEQQGKCLYSGKAIDLNKLFADNYYQVDHVMPYSLTFNDSYNNKVLVCIEENQRKGNRLPCEYMNGEQYAQYVSRVNALYAQNFAKKQILLKQKIDYTEWKSRALNDTRYICTFVSDLLRNHLLFSDNYTGKKRVFCYNGRMTAELRRCWGVSKVREDGDLHHAVDATVVACMTDKMLKRITDYYLHKEEGYAMVDNTIVDTRTGEVMRTVFPLPYESFRSELTARFSEDRAWANQQLMLSGYSDAEIDGVSLPIISRMPKHKVTGQIHDATVRSAKYYQSQGIVITKESITKLKLSADGQSIENYYNPSSDRLLYQRLLGLLQQYGGDAAKAFEQPVYKPCANGANGHVVRKVKTISRPTQGVLLAKTKGFAQNGSMVRVDVFSKDGKYYCVPVYTKDVYSGILPNKAVVAHKPYEQWIDVDDSYTFEFSMYPDDLLYVSNGDKGITLSKIRKSDKSDKADTITFGSGYVYFEQFDSSTGSASLTDVYNCYSTRIGLKTLKSLSKCQVDVLGNVTSVGKQKRQPLKR